MILSNDTGLTDHLVCMASKISGVTGSLTLLPLGAERRIPLRHMTAGAEMVGVVWAALRQCGKTCMHSDTWTQSEGTKSD